VWIFSETRCPSNNPTENSQKVEGQVKLVAMLILPRRAEGTGVTGLSPWKHEEIEG
jgi:hypothetical protein